MTSYLTDITIDIFLLIFWQLAQSEPKLGNFQNLPETRLKVHSIRIKQVPVTGHIISSCTNQKHKNLEQTSA